MDYNFLVTLFGEETVRAWTVDSLIIMGIWIGPFLAFAATQGASFKCYRAFLRLLHRLGMVLMSLSCFWLASFIDQTGRFVSGPSFLFVITIFICTVINALRMFMAADISEDARWPWQLSDRQVQAQFPWWARHVRHLH